MEKLTNLLATSQVDQTKALASLDRVLDTERDNKRAQVGLMVDVKDKLRAAPQVAQVARDAEVMAVSR